MDKNLDYHAFLESFGKSDKQILTSRDSEKLDCTPVIQQIKNRVLHPEARLRSVFTKINTDNEWQVTRPELKKAIELGVDFKLDDDSFKELTTILDPGNTNIINCADFIRLFEGPCDSSCIGVGDVNTTNKKLDLEKYRSLSGDKLQSKLKYHLNKNLDNIEKAILVCDPDQSGFISPEKLMRILSGFCFPLTEDQFEETIEESRKFGNNVNYHEFLKMFKKKPDEDTRKWVETVDKLVNYKSRCPPAIDVTEVEEMLRDCVRYRKTAILNDFRALDVCNVGVICKDDARNVFSKFAFRFTDDQFNEIWKGFPRNKYDQLFYDEFLEEYSRPASSSADTEAKTDSTCVKSKEGMEDNLEIPSKKEGKATVRFTDTDSKSAQSIKKDVTAKPTENRKTSKEALFSEAPQLKQILESIEPAVIRNFRSIKYHLRRADPTATHTVNFVTLKSILSKSGIYFSKEDEFRILEYFDANMKGRINYGDFLNLFVWYA